jgi:hypothetical protein
MTDSEDSPNPDYPIEPPRVPIAARIVEYVRRRRYERKVERQEETTADKAARIAATATAWIAFFTLVSLAVSTATFLILKHQLREMHESGVDTHTLAQQAITQATQTTNLALAAKSQADAAKATADATKQVADRTLAQSTATNDLARQARRQADIAIEALRASIESADQDRRPWVGLQLLQCNDCKTEPDGSLLIGSLSAVLVNTGKTPAIDMIVDWTFESIKASDPIPTYDAIEKESESERQRAFTIPPNLSPDEAASMSKEFDVIKRRLTPSKEILAPNAARGITIIASFRQARKMTPNVEDQNTIYGLGKVTYYDPPHKIQHVTTFCVMNEIGVDFRYCPSGNEMN